MFYVSKLAALRIAGVFVLASLGGCSSEASKASGASEGSGASGASEGSGASGASGGAQPPGPKSLAVVFTPKGGTFQASEPVELTVEDERAAVHFTTDGSLPTASSPVYVEPLVLTTSTRVRALAVVPHAAPSGAGGSGGAGSDGADLLGPIASEAYFKVAADTAEFISELPIVVIHTFESRRLDPLETEFVPATFMLLEPRDGQTKLLGRASFDGRIGIHVRGATSRDFPKKQYAVEFRDDALDTDLDREFLGMPADSDWVLSDPVSFDRTLIRNALAFEMSNRIGRYAPRTRFVEVFLVDSGADVAEKSFLGFYTAIEKIKRGQDRVPVAKLSADDLTEPDVTGGFLLRIDKGDNDFKAAGEELQFVYPDPEDMLKPAREPQFDFIRGYIDDFGQAVDADDFKQPGSGKHYSSFIDQDAFIDHNIISALTKNVDALRISTYFFKDRQGLLSAGPVWDFDRSLGTPYDERAFEPEEWKLEGSDGTDYFTEGWWGSLFRDPAFQARYKARFLALLQGELAPDELDAMVDGLVRKVGAPAVERNFARWQDSPPLNGSHDEEISLLKDFLRRRASWIHDELMTW
ncbi:CotH kinase family protein [Sorangium sp. So ce448]|uniref:CotH kinase family protein n=1 Tax=Sorangium sp. So ce448 TaxID=3133314 RepID=UPI003F63C2F7